ncbi:unnamed protein product [Arctogadus glacialis]
MLNTFAAAGHHQYAKGARLYVQLMQQRQDCPMFQEPLSKFTDRKTLVSSSTGFSSTPGDSVNADQGEEVGRAIHAKMDGKTVLDTMETEHKNQKLRKPDKAALAKFLKAFVEPVEKKTCTSLVVDGGWLLHSVKWEANLAWKDIAEN